MPAPQITALPDPPSRQDPTNFAVKGDAFLGGLPTFATEANALATQVNERVDAAFAAGLESAATNAATTVTKAAEARASELAAAGYANAAALVATGFDTLRPKIRAALNLDFVNQEFVDRRVVVSRAGPKSYFGKRKVLGDENLLRFSEQFDNAVWGKAGSTVSANSTSAPDGATTADSLIVQTTATERKSAGYTIALLANTSYVFSLSAKANQLGFVTLTSNRNNTEYFSVTFSLADGTVSQNTTSGGFTVASAASVLQPNGFYRLYVAFSATVAPSAVSAALSNAGTFTPDALGRNAFAGNIGDGVFVWGAQLEQRSALTAYIRTTDYPVRTFFNALETAAANVMPVEYDPVTQQCLGIKPESAATNLFLRSEEFDNAYWSKTSLTVTANAAIAPNGTLTADKLVGTGNNPFLSRNSVYLAGVGIHAVFAKAGELGFLRMTRVSIGSSAWFNLQTGQIGTVQGSGLTAYMKGCGGGWYLCAIISTAALNDAAIMAPTNADGASTSYTGDGFSGLYLWGAQLEASTLGVPSSYIPTTSAQVTRLADNPTIPVSEFDYNQNEGTLYAEVSTPVAADSGLTEAIVRIHDGSFNNLIGFIRASAGASDRRAQAAVINQGTTQVDLFGTANSLVSNTNTRLAFTYAKNSAAFYLNNTLIGSDSAAEIPVNLTTMSIGLSPDGTSQFNGYIRCLRYYNAALSSAEAQALSKV